MKETQHYLENQEASINRAVCFLLSKRSSRVQIALKSRLREVLTLLLRTQSTAQHLSTCLSFSVRFQTGAVQCPRRVCLVISLHNRQASLLVRTGGIAN
jgi:hypothetical protein